MKIVFWGWKDAFDYYRIGGAESYIRRISQGLIVLGHSVTYIMYGADKSKTIQPEEFQATLHYAKTFREALRLLEQDAVDIIIDIYTHPRFRLSFSSFRKHRLAETHQATILFSPFRFIWKEYLGSFILRSYDSVFVVSQRIENQMKRNNICSTVLTPPVSDVFFEASRSRKPSKDGKIRVGYIGRADHGKGFDIAVNVMKNLPKDSFASRVMTYSWGGRQEIIESSKDSGIDIEVTDYRQYKKDIESRVAGFLSQTDLLLLPYRTIDTTIDMPLSIIEGLCAGCSIVLPKIEELASFFTNFNGYVVPLSEFRNSPKASIESLHVCRRQERTAEHLTQVYGTKRVASLLINNIKRNKEVLIT